MGKRSRIPARAAGILKVSAGLVAALMAAGAALVWIDRPSASSVQEAEATHLRTGIEAAGRLAVWFDLAAREAEAVAGAMSPWAGSPGEVGGAGPRLDQLVSIATAFEPSAILVDPGGRVVATTSSRSGVLGLPRDGSHIQGALAGSTTFSSVVEDPLDKLVSVEAAAPLKNSAGGVSGAVVLRSPVTGGSLSEALAGLVRSKRTELFLVGPDSTALVAGSKEHSVERDPLDVRVAAERARREGKPGLSHIDGEGGVPKVAAYASLVDGWSTILIESEASLYAAGRTLPERLVRPGPTRRAALVLVALAPAFVLSTAVLTRRWRRARAESENAKRAFLAITGHELRTPLTVIRGLSQTLDKRWDAVAAKDRREMISSIGTHARSLEHVVERLIIAAQLEAGIGSAPMPRKTDVNEVVDRAVNHYRALTKIHELHLHTNGRTMAVTDSKSLELVMGHLLENAVKYSPAGGSIEVTTRPAGGRVEIVVEDEGVG
ncbi:MAG: histidine kinase dimerization/phospho-acceptor domain-containing protein, partial [Actinomycetota bacterium]